jgi:replicative DNA helicase
VQEISEITRGLKGIAKELDVPVIALSQLSRQVENREDKRPQLADLRESGSIEQDADVVMFIYREAYYEQNKIPIKRGDEDEGSFQARMDAWQDHMSAIHNQASVIISKNRHGPTGDVTLFFDGSTTRFSDYVDDGRYANSPGY